VFEDFVFVLYRWRAVGCPSHRSPSVVALVGLRWDRGMVRRGVVVVLGELVQFAGKL
jgi:hypothetical protein